MGKIIVSQKAGFFSRVFKTISQAIRTAKSGDQIFIEPGTYSEEVIIDKPLTLMGSSPSAVLIEGTMRVRAKSVRVEQLLIKHRVSESALHIQSYSDADVINCQIVGQDLHQNTVFVYEKGNVRLTRCSVSLGKYGIAIDAAMCVVSECEITNVEEDGLFAIEGATVRISDSRVHGCRKNGLSAMQAKTHLDVSKCQIYNNGIAGVSVAGSGGGVFNCIFESCPTGLVIRDSEMFVSGGEVRGCEQAGIFVMGKSASPNIANVSFQSNNGLSVVFVKGARGRLSALDYHSRGKETAVGIDHLSSPNIELDSHGRQPTIINLGAR